MSAINTILVVDFCCCREYYADAFTLARKYRDDLLQYLFTLDVIQNIHGLSKDELKKYDVLNPESLLDMLLKEIQILSSGERKSQEELAVEAFMYNTIEDDLHSKDRRMYFDTSKYKANLMERNPQIKILMEKYLDALEMGYSPEEGSQYWVSPIIVEYFDEHLNKIDKGLLE